jgi:3-oxoacyl-[acyl-carrier protein] reductase
VNLDGAFFCLRAAIPRLRAAGGGRIVNISSGAARTGGIIGAHYAASKAGMLALTARAARELAGDGIAVNALLPSVIETDMLPTLARDDAARARLRAVPRRSLRSARRSRGRRAVFMRECPGVPDR